MELSKNQQLFLLLLFLFAILYIFGRLNNNSISNCDCPKCGCLPNNDCKCGSCDCGCGCKKCSTYVGREMRKITRIQQENMLNTFDYVDETMKYETIPQDSNKREEEKQIKMYQDNLPYMKETENDIINAVQMPQRGELYIIP